MTDAERSFPRHLLLATDLSARCDRAQDRAVGLARAWQAKLTIVHVVEVADLFDAGQDATDAAAAGLRAYDEIRRALADVHDVEYDIVVREGTPAEVILDIAGERSCDLVLTGVAGNDALGQSLLGSTASALARQAATTVLVVKKRARSDYRGAVVSSDLSDASNSALDMGVRLFAPSHLTLFHAFDMPFRGFVDDKIAYEQSRGAMTLDEAKAFLEANLGDASTVIDVRVAFGDPAIALAAHVLQADADLVIAGTHGRSGIFSIMLGSVAEAILTRVPCDVMIVPSRGARGAVS